jgi:chromatin segregation and condensation protein Rec8/ScpA/Scc1 (kleisin family)
MHTEQDKVWVLFEWELNEDKRVIGLFRTWQKARDIAHRRKGKEPHLIHDWEEYKVED